MSKFVPYKNESDVRNIGHLSIENRLDRVTISGDIDLTADQAGLSDARALYKLLGDVVKTLAAQELPDKLVPPQSKIVVNPFD